MNIDRFCHVKENFGISFWDIVFTPLWPRIGTILRTFHRDLYIDSAWYSDSDIWYTEITLLTAIFIHSSLTFFFVRTTGHWCRFTSHRANRTIFPNYRKTRKNVTRSILAFLSSSIKLPFKIIQIIMKKKYYYYIRSIAIHVVFTCRKYTIVGQLASIVVSTPRARIPCISHHTQILTFYRLRNWRTLYSLRDC